MGENQLSRKLELYGANFCISYLKVSRTKILHHSLNFNAFFMVQEYFSQNLKFLQIKEGRAEFLGGGNSAESLNYLVPPFFISILKV